MSSNLIRSCRRATSPELSTYIARERPTIDSFSKASSTSFYKLGGHETRRTSLIRLVGPMAMTGQPAKATIIQRSDDRLAHCHLRAIDTSRRNVSRRFASSRPNNMVVPYRYGMALTSWADATRTFSILVWRISQQKKCRDPTLIKLVPQRLYSRPSLRP